MLLNFKYYDIHITETKDLRGGCSPVSVYSLSGLVTRRAGLVDIRNTDNKCLLYCIAAAFVCKNGWTSWKKSDPVNYEVFVDMIKTSNHKKTIKLPIALETISDLESFNRRGSNAIKFRINVFREDISSKQLQLIRHSSFNDGKIINVLLVEIEHAGVEYSHFVLIYKKSFLKKVYLSNINEYGNYANTLFCDLCFARFRSEKMLSSHSDICGKDTHKKVFPDPKETLYFKKYEYKYKHIFTGYADFESILKPDSNEIECPKCEGETDPYICDHSFTIITKTHQPICVSFVIVDRYGNLVHEFTYTGTDVVERFINNVLSCEDLLVNTAKFNEYMIFTEQDKFDFERSTVCYICKNTVDPKTEKEKPFSNEDPKCRDHDHITGR